MTVVDLAGARQVREALGDAWRWYSDASHLPKRAADSWTSGWLPATVPGSVPCDVLLTGSDVRVDVEGPEPLLLDRFNLAPVTMKEIRWSR